MLIYNDDSLESSPTTPVVITSATNETECAASNTSSANVFKMKSQSGSSFGNILKFLLGTTQTGSIESQTNGKLKLTPGAGSWVEIVGKLKALTGGVSASSIDSLYFAHLVEGPEPDSAPDNSLLIFEGALCFKKNNALYAVQLSSTPVAEF